MKSMESGQRPESFENSSNEVTLSCNVCKSLTPKQEKILLHIKSKLVEKDSSFYTRSKEIGQALGLTSHEVGSNLKKICNKVEPESFSIERWAKSNSTTWRITNK
jgi:uncharacterized membrane protein